MTLVWQLNAKNHHQMYVPLIQYATLDTHNDLLCCNTSAMSLVSVRFLQLPSSLQLPMIAVMTSSDVRRQF